MTDTPRTEPTLRRICVYTGASSGKRSEFASAAKAMGRALGERGIGLVYGGGHVGLMGLVADAALSAGSEVIGVIPSGLVDRELGHRGVTSLEVVPDMHTRKARMAELADAFVSLPGGIGTLEELFETWTWAQIGLHTKPIGLLNVDGFYDHLLAFLDLQVAEGFLPAASRAHLVVGTDPGQLIGSLAARRAGLADRWAAGAR